jgi:hypothetical protein
MIKYFLTNSTSSGYFKEPRTVVNRDAGTGRCAAKAVRTTGPSGDRAYTKLTTRLVVKKYALKRD